MARAFARLAAARNAAVVAAAKMTMASEAFAGNRFLMACLSVRRASNCLMPAVAVT
jgi:hypothetical protein